jgi:hypothetical protein
MPEGSSASVQYSSVGPIHNWGRERGNKSCASVREAREKNLAKPRIWGVQSMAEALKPEHGLETLAIKILGLPPPFAFLFGD